MKGFLQFIREQGVVGLAVGFILGGAISKLVSSFVLDIVNPLVGVVMGATRLDKTYFRIGPAKIIWGHFVSSLIDFLIITLIVYFAVRILRIEGLIQRKK